jgi:tRNA pseudouridine32 synthase / 23S rRNA pseudouridine746 synthase
LKCGFQRPPTAMHRLDTDTSGCLLFARTAKARSSLQQAFETRAVEKYYLAVVAAEIPEEKGVIDVPLAKRSTAEAGWRMVRDPNGHEATTLWRRLSIRDGSTLVEFQPLTGRTHQIRVHAREAFGRGIQGDRVYGIPGGPMLLHASRLVVPRRGKQTIEAAAPLPDYFGDWRDAA